ncbi:MAG: sigma-54 dependent transcriptional regulator [Thermoguttaceae bacterium]|jgi:nitrogen regulation protein NR(I)|nr:sigma-54 dependent transcriptional regulator [Thermoguttaceae bacterium]
MSRILVVDDEPSVRAAFEAVLAGLDHEVVCAAKGAEALQRLKEGPFDLVLLDVCMPGMSGLAALDRIRELQPRLPVIVMTGQGTMETAIEATRRGAFDYHLKPLDPGEMLATIDKALECSRLARGEVRLGADAPPSSADAIIGRCAAMQEVFKAIGRVAPTDATVLIRGETGTGKELVARALYQYSSRAAKPFLPINCVAIPETLLEGELFGHEAGAFTGAERRRIGKFEQAQGGTIFLDEIGDLPPGAQAKLLRLLQERRFERIGSNETIQVDVRIVAATNRDLEESIARGSFREDLYHRLNVVTIRLPPLRERRDDIPLLVDYFLERFSRELDCPRPTLSPEAMERLERFPWPGNVRQLRHVLHRTMIFTRGYPIQVSDLASALEAEPATVGEIVGSARRFDALAGEFLDTYRDDDAYDAFLGSAERAILAEALRRTGGNRTHAARLLGIPRPTLQAKIQKHRLSETL